MGLHARAPGGRSACPGGRPQRADLPAERGAARPWLSVGSTFSHTDDEVAAYRSLDFTAEFLASFGRFSKTDQRRLVKALGLLDSNEQHPSLRVHELSGDLEGTWSASASDDLRITFTRTAGGRKILLVCSRHYA